MAKTTTPNNAAAVRQRGVTMSDVAQLAGVSRTAVSFVLSNRENASISEQTRTRINDAVQALGYRPNAGARALASQRSDWYGIVTEIVGAAVIRRQLAQEVVDQCDVLILIEPLDVPGQVWISCRGNFTYAGQDNTGQGGDRLRFIAGHKSEPARFGAKEA